MHFERKKQLNYTLRYIARQQFRHHFYFCITGVRLTGGFLAGPAAGWQFFNFFICRRLFIIRGMAGWSLYSPVLTFTIDKCIQHYAANSCRTSGCRVATFSNVAAAPDGIFLPCSHS